MDLKDQLKLIADRTKHKENIQTEEATKNAFVMPFLQSLGYDVFNPLEVVPEFVADLGIKKGEKIDYAIFKDGNPTILVECKDWRQNLNIHEGQILRYFHVSKAKFALLTNGIVYRFYTDLVKPNIMDEKPFLEFNITEIRDNQIEELKKFHKENFNVESIINTASELKFMNELKQLIHQELTEPSAEFVRHFAKQVYPSVVNARVLEQFTELTKKSTQQYISELITERLRTALSKEDEKNKLEVLEQNLEDISKVNTTEEEMEAFLIVKTILRQKISSDRITFRDAQSYFSVFIDDNNRKVVCRFYLSGIKKSIGIFDNAKKETKIEILTLDEVYKYTDDLLKTVENF
jgi:predicted type IV restriction endonuclease